MSTLPITSANHRASLCQKQKNVVSYQDGADGAVCVGGGKVFCLMRSCSDTGLEMEEAHTDVTCDDVI